MSQVWKMQIKATHNNNIIVMITFVIIIMLLRLKGSGLPVIYYINLTSQCCHAILAVDVNCS